jgi:hypothetical protein
MISTIDRKRIFIFVAIAYGLSIAMGVVIFFGGGLSRLSALLSVAMFAPMIAHGVHNTSNKLMLFFLSGEPNLLLGPGTQGIIGSLGYAVLALVIFFNPRALAQSTSVPGNTPTNVTLVG